MMSTPLARPRIDCDRLLVGLTGLFLILSISRPWVLLGLGSFQPHDDKRLLEIALLLAFAAIFIFTGAQNGRWLGPPESPQLNTRRGLGAIAILGIGSVMLAAAPGRASFEFAIFLLGGFLIVALAAARHRLGPGFDRMMAVTIAASVFIYLLLFLVVYSSAVSTQIALPDDITHDVRALVRLPNFSNRRFFDQYQTWTLPLICLPLVVLRLRWAISRIALYLIAMGWWALFFTGDSRAKVLGVVVSVVGVIAIYRRLARPWVSLQAICATGGLVIHWLVFVLAAADTAGPLVRDIGHSRLDLWRQGLQLAAQNPWFGVGPLHYSDVSGIAHPHNALVQWLAEWGLPSTGILVAVMITGFAAWIKFSRRQLDANTSATGPDPVLYPALTAACLAAATHAMLSGIIVMPMSQVMLAVVLGWMMGLRQGGPAFPSAGGSNRRRIAVVPRLIVLAAALTLGADLARDIDDVAAIGADPGTGVAALSPRLWSDGRLPLEPD